jgi:hypothetical protein
MIRRALLVIFVTACGGRITGESDASTHGDASNDAAAASSDATSGTIVTCGPNTCHAGEICCNEKCGVCSFPDECVVHDCGGP